MTNAERQRAYRARRNAEGVTEPVTGVTDVTPTVTPRNADTVTALRQRVTELEDEVARLKRELAGRTVTKPLPMTGGSLAGNLPAVGTVQHGASCHCFNCWQTRKAGRRRNA